MNPPQAPSITTVVTGDVTMDWHIVTLQESSKSDWRQLDWTRACWQRGGAALLADLVENLADSIAADQGTEMTVLQNDAPRTRVHPDDPRFHHSYAVWSRFPKRRGFTWRVQEYLGLDRNFGSDAPTDWKRVANDKRNADIVILDDANLGFRDDPELWPAAIAAGSNPQWVLVKMAQPVADGRLWDHLCEHHLDRLIAVIPVGDLRRTEAHISRGLSWERTAQDVAWELGHNPRLNKLSRCAHVVISFATAGAMLLSSGEDEDESSAASRWLFFDPKVIEGMWERNHPGRMIGYTTCLTAGIALQLLRSDKKPDIHLGIHSGLNAMRLLHSDGYEMIPAETGRLHFPVDRIVGELVASAKTFASVEVQDPMYYINKGEDPAQTGGSRGWWTILEDRYHGDLGAIAEQIVLKGAEVALRDIPQGRFGHLLTVDRQEIESFRSIHALAAEYLSKEKQKRPLSIAVFGAPGSGKSFGLTQVAKTLAPGQIEVLEFNLSQFSSPDEIVDALHQVRDATLSGSIPLVFWDEFDSSQNGSPLGWLRYFLAPMQEGTFREGQIFHPIGRAIFAFAGGTSHHMEAFGKNLDPDEYRAAKVPDFVSRLKGYVNVLGPNASKDAVRGPGSSDPHYLIRRAIILRSILERNTPQLFEHQELGKDLRVDHGVLHAFLNVSEYKHGIRSMEAIVTMSQLSGKSGFERSNLPPEGQLELHVDGQEFLSLVQRLSLAGEILERLARSHHELFCQELVSQSSESETAAGEGRISSSPVSYDQLPENEREQNRDAVRDIPNKLALIGHAMIPARSDQPPFEFPEGDEDLERLARIEHQRWMRRKLEAGWKYAPQTDKKQRLHRALLPWDELPEEQKEKDRALVRALPRILAQAGYTVVKLNQEE